MAGKPRPKLSEKQWKALAPKCRKAAKYTADSIKAWSAVSSEAVNGNPHADWRWLLIDLRNRCIDSDIDCPYSVTYLIQLADTYTAVKGDLERDVPVSVLVEGRNLPNLLDIVEDEGEDLSVSRIKAYVYKDANDDEREVDEIESELRTKRDSEKERKTRRRHAEKIEGWAIDKSDNLLPTMKAEITSYRSAILRMTAEGREFDATEIALALDAVRQLAATLEAVRPSLKKAA